MLDLADLASRPVGIVDNGELHQRWKCQVLLTRAVGKYLAKEYLSMPYLPRHRGIRRLRVSRRAIGTRNLPRSTEPQEHPFHAVGKKFMCPPCNELVGMFASDDEREHLAVCCSLLVN